MNKFTERLNSIVRLSASAIEDLEANIIPLKLEKNQLLLKQGQVCHNLYFVETGLLRQYYSEGEKDITDYFAFESRIAGGISSFFSRKPGQKIIESIEPCNLLTISSVKLEKLFDKHHDIERVGRLIAIDAFISMEERIYSLQFHSAKKRYDNFLKSNPGILQRAPLGHIASYLGITQVTLSRIRSEK